MQEMWVWSLGQEDPLEKGMRTHCSILTWRIPWTEEPGSLQPTGSQKAGHSWATKQAEGYQILHQSFLGFRNNMNPILLVPEFAFFQFMCSESPDCLCRQISFVYTEWKWRSLSHVPFFVTLWTAHSPWNSPGQNTGVGSLSLLQQIFPNQGWNPGLPHCRRILYQLSHGGAPAWHGYPLFQWLNPGGRELLLLGFGVLFLLAVPPCSI